MKWVLFAAASLSVWSLGLWAFGANALSECFPGYADFEECRIGQNKDALLIAIATLGVWLLSAFLIFRKRSLN